MILWLLLQLLSTTSAALQNNTLVNQTNAIVRYPNTANKIMCQNMTDQLYYPLILGADDMVLPPGRAALGCQSLLFTFSTIRTRQDLNPSNITLWLLRHDAASGGPGDVFYASTQAWPLNNYRWRDDAISIPFDSQLRLTHGDVADDGTTVFDLNSESFMPSNQPVWVALYVAMSLHQIQAGFRRNAFYWATLDTNNGSAPVQPQLWGGVTNRHFFYRDVRNKEKLGFVNWTDGAIASIPLGVVSTTSQMAWRVDLQCNGTLSWPVPVTETPSAAPSTSVPSSSSSSPSSPSPPSPTIATTPTTPTTVTLEPIDNGGGNGTDVNGTLLGDKLRTPLYIGLSFAVVLLICVTICLVCACWRFMKRRRAARLTKTHLNQMLVSGQEEANQRMFGANPLYPPVMPQQSSGGSGAVRIFTAGAEARPVNYSTSSSSPSRGGGDSYGNERIYNDLLNRHVDTTDEDG